MAIQPRNLVHAERGYASITAAPHKLARYVLPSKRQEALTKTLTALLHLCDRDSLDFGGAMQDATNQYLDQTDHPMKES